MGEGEDPCHEVIGQRLLVAPDLHIEALAAQHLGRHRRQQPFVVRPARLPERGQPRQEGGAQDQAQGPQRDPGRQQFQAVRTAAAAWSPSSSTAISRILYFWTLPLIVIGHISVPFRNFQ